MNKDTAALYIELRGKFARDVLKKVKKELMYQLQVYGLQEYGLQEGDALELVTLESAKQLDLFEG